ncbi:MAG: glycerophosphodiester phosphodiesterase [Anaerolineales bacterium]
MLPKVIAHRGASAHAPENTMAAFQLAFDQGADGIELDVMLNKENRVVVIHDDTVDRTTNGTGKVSQMTLEQLKFLDAGDGERIPTLSEVLERFGGRFLINIELKNYHSMFDKLPIVVMKLVKSFNLAESVLLSSFNPFNLSRIHRHLPQVKLGLITQPKMAKSWLWRLFPHDALHPYFNDVDQKLVTGLHTNYREVNVWTVDEPAEMRRLALLGVDSIITNYPKRAQEVLESLS